MGGDWLKKAENTHEWINALIAKKKRKKARELPHPFCYVSIQLSMNQETGFSPDSKSAGKMILDFPASEL